MDADDESLPGGNVHPRAINPKFDNVQQTPSSEDRYDDVDEKNSNKKSARKSKEKTTNLYGVELRDKTRKN